VKTVSSVFSGLGAPVAVTSRRDDLVVLIIRELIDGPVRRVKCHGLSRCAGDVRATVAEANL
jgi:hypothetical protein